MYGSISRTVHAIAAPERAVPPAETDPITYGNVFRFSLKTVPAVGVIDQIPWNENSSCVIQAGLIIGIIILQYITNTFAPSILAASIIVSGTPESTYCLIRKAPIEDGITGRIYTQYVSIIPSLLKIRYWGTPSVVPLYKSEN